MGLKQFLTNNWRLFNSNNVLLNRSANSILESHNTGYAQKAVKMELPPKPKKPSPPFFRFLEERKMAYIKTHNASINDAVKAISELWNNYDEDKKNKMRESYAVELKKYKDDYEVYKKNLTEEQKNELYQRRYRVAELKLKRKHKKEMKKLGKPARPLTGYLLFVSEKMRTHRHTPAPNYMAQVAGEWKKMDSETRKKYNDEAAEKLQEYNKLLKEWEERMVKAGRVDLVRTRFVTNYSVDD